MRCRSPEQHRRKGTTNSHTGNSTSMSLCTTSSPSLSSVCRRGGEGEGALWFPVLWVILPHPAPGVPCLVVPCVGQGARPSFGEAVTRMTYDCLLKREAWLGGEGWGGGGGIPWGGAGACDAAPYMGGCQNLGPLLGTLHIRCRIILRNQKGTLILTTTHMYPYRTPID